MSQPQDTASPDQVADYRAAQEAEYGQFVAVTRIYHGSALAYRPGQAVPASNVEKYGYEKNGLVRKVEVEAEVTKAKPPTVTTTASASTSPAADPSQKG